ncbi:ABC transporter substrate-binding protein [Mesorhizobium sp.]|uniref:ABC transporter substrate-binding protein n=1 Tax=Mesorhizobium sp. TaxID=1871066 RepID=UPI000FE3EE1C|nr:ABC transporter substrate-binding protein [Mesorhizobium sp.]RWH69324.1 MAG: ABC transporter substrate-binding protein [Mesorhizobium sp.]RWL27811.1 MAG: ABC transporter substrate-binding protein [Mesorhizobium sp.]RWL29120.1 MAG: ABC transporter substrate-binding protein [Mesorhizobium sp.]RWL37288.1 MAG: ABC transporter substrate-binding protein [Mesorhizobium sp.]RWL55623.1 MAG: ABC transporter substrate-binding protein [Mesorhizobium sp.]
MNISRRTVLIGTTTLSGLLAMGLGGSPAFAMDGPKTLRLPLARPAGNLDPQRYVGIFAIQDMIFDPLVQYTRGGKIEPGLAESWTISEDHKVYTFKLRPNVVFTDGEPWNAEAMKWNLDRWMPKADYNWLQVSANLDKIEVIDPMTVAIHFKQVTPTALIEFSYVRPVRFLSPRAVEADGSYKSPIGTGAWKVDSDTPEGTDLVPNDKYWGAKPTLDKVSLVVIPDARSRMSALLAGDIDAAGGAFIAAVSPQDATTLKSGGITIATDTGTDTMILGFNPRRELFKDIKVREAFNLLIDREAICTALMKGYATPTMNLYPDVIAYSGKRFDVPKRDVERAKKLLDEAGWVGEGTRSKDGKPLNVELVISEDAVANSRALGEVLQAEFSEAGIGLTLRNVDHAARHGDIPQFKYDISLFITNGAPYDPYNTLGLMILSSVEPGTDGKLWEDPAVDPLIMRALSAPEAERPEAFQAVATWLHDNWAIAPLYHAQRIWAHGDRVKTFVVPATEYEMPIKGISL